MVSAEVDLVVVVSEAEDSEDSEVGVLAVVVPEEAGNASPDTNSYSIFHIPIAVSSLTRAIDLS